MLVPSVLAGLLKTGMQSITPPITPQKTHDKFCEILNTYIKSSADIVFAWAAALASPPFTPDPTIIANGKFVTCEIATSPGFLPDPITGLVDFSLKITTTFGTSATYTITDPGFTVTPGGYITAIPLVITPSLLPDPDANFLYMATTIITWLKLNVSGLPVAGAHPPYVGSGTITTIL